MGVLGDSSPLTPLLANPLGLPGPPIGGSFPTTGGQLSPDPFAGMQPAAMPTPPDGPWLQNPRPTVSLMQGLAAPLQAERDQPWYQQLGNAARGVVDATSLGSPVGSELAMFVGPRAVGADMGLLAEAKQMAGSGIHPNDIWFRTGWFQGKDGGWRYEIPDWNMVTNRGGEPGTPQAAFYQKYNDTADAAIIRMNADKLNVTVENVASALAKQLGRPVSPQAVNLARNTPYSDLKKGLAALDIKDPRYRDKQMRDVIQHPDLWAAYPDIAKMSIREASPLEFSNSMGTLGGYSPALDAIRINKTVRPDESLGVLSHELQHAVQQREGWTPGARFSGDWDAYERNAGEVEARNTEARRKLSPLERRMTLPWNTMDVPLEQQLLTGTPSTAARMTPAQFHALIDYMRGLQRPQ